MNRHARPARKLAAVIGLFLLRAALARAAAPDPDHLVRELEGGWAGEATLTPDGPSSFALLFERDASGRLSARTHGDRETYVQLTFVPVEGSGWHLVETGARPDVGVQSRELVPAAGPPGVVRWVTPGPAGDLVVDFALRGARLAIDVVLRGAPHASFRLERLPAEGLPALREALARLAEREPGSPLPQSPQEAEDAPAEAGPTAEQALAAARREVAAHPDDARAQLGLGRAILNVLAESPARGMFLGGDCVRALTRATQLDPGLGEAHRLLALYRLNAPAIGGGSKQKALQSARAYAELDPERGAEFLARVERVVAGR